MKPMKLPPRLVNFKGMTLIEMMIVVGLIAGVYGLAANKFSSQDRQIRLTIRQFVTLARDVRKRAQRKQGTHRVQFNLDSKPQTYSVDASDELVFYFVPDEEDDDRKAPPASFAPVRNQSKKVKLPSKLKITQIEVDKLGVFTSGNIPIYFQPSGRTLATSIQLSADKLKWTLFLNPFTSEFSVLSSHKSLEDILEEYLVKSEKLEKE